MSRYLIGALLSFCSIVSAQALADAHQSSAAAPNSVPSHPLPIKVVVVAMFERGEITGDGPGEFQYWVERLPLEQQFDFPLGPFPLRYREDGVLGICIGGGIANAAASIMALGLDPRFDLSSSYWLVAGIAGGDPEDSTLGSAVWAKHIVDGDLLYEIDGREIPPEWPYGMIPLGGEHPAESPEDLDTGWTLNNIHIPLNPNLAQWAYEQTQAIKIPDSEALQSARETYTGYHAALAPPQVIIGDTLSASTYWHGGLLNQWANDWVALYAGEGANFVTSNMEDSGTLTSIRRLDGIGKADVERVMVLRTVSNFTMPPPGKPAAWSATADYPGNGLPALESAYQVGKPIVETLVADWARYRETIPQPKISGAPGQRR